jgi:putative membrane protein
MGIGMLAWVILLAVAIGLVVWLVNRAGGQRVERGDSAEEVLRRRFAAGEIDAEEYASRLSVLRR